MANEAHEDAPTGAAPGRGDPGAGPVPAAPGRARSADDYWTERAPRYDRTAWVHDRSLMECFLSLLPDVGPHRALEVGIGTGAVARDLAGRVDAIVGIDLSAAMIRSVDDPRIGRCVADAHRLPFPDARFDVVCMRNVLHYLADPAVAFAEMRRCLRPGGAYLFSQVVPRDDAISGEYDWLVNRGLHYPTGAEILGLFDGFRLETRFDFVLPAQSVGDWLANTCRDPRRRAETMRRHREASARYKALVNYRERGDDVLVDITHLMVRASRPRA